MGTMLQLQQSNATQLTLKRVDLNMSGKYSCEVTTDYDFNTDLKTSYLYVVGKLWRYLYGSVCHWGKV